MRDPRRWWQEVEADDWAAFATSDDLVRERYTALLAALEELSTRGPMATLPDISAQVRVVGYHDPLSEGDLRESLDKLATWGFAEPFRDYAAPVRSLQGVIVRQEAWALSRKGRGIVAAVRLAVVDARRALQLPSRLLDGVESTIRALLEHAANDPGRLPIDLDDVRTRIDELRRVTADFYDALARIVQSDVTDDSVFGDNRDRVIEALRQFPREYGRALRRVEYALEDLKAAGHHAVAEAAVAHAGLIDAAEQQSWVEDRVRRLADLAAWFHQDGGVRRLIGSATGAVHTLLVAIDRRYTARRRGSDLGHDFRLLARSLHRQSTDQEARRVYAAAFGDWPAWHAVPRLAEEDVAHGTLAAAGRTRHQVEVTLREHERHGPPSGRPRKLVDTSRERERAAAQAADEASQRRHLATLLATDGEVSLDHFTGYASAAVVVLLRAVEVALAQLDPGTGIGQAYADGASVRVLVRVGAPGRTVRVRLADGVLAAPDVRVRVIPSGDIRVREDRKGGVA
ncbi:uncharacterized protein (TIGR02677 family) [Saccharothrix saharensis]|uniref:Uncharacterized protein (TIGR02677 family) n=1 Tax=Saccharothrix saharensis TaxID=571190 RepID=A0A543JRK2_9PSEU|nr:uncharacterized protein (TIGR02677 family) [Saccharothrix saharensis]